MLNNEVKEIAFEIAKKFKVSFDYQYKGEETEIYSLQKLLKEKGKVWRFRKVGGKTIKDRVLNKWIPKIQLEKCQISIFDIMD